MFCPRFGLMWTSHSKPGLFIPSHLFECQILGCRISSSKNPIQGCHRTGMSEFPDISIKLKWENVTFHVQPLSWRKLSQLQHRKWSLTKLDSFNTVIKILYNFNKDIAQNCSWHWLNLYMNKDFAWVFSISWNLYQNSLTFPWHFATTHFSLIYCKIP